MHVRVRAQARELRATAHLVCALGRALHPGAASTLVKSSLGVKLVPDDGVRQVGRHVASAFTLHKPQL